MSTTSSVQFQDTAKPLAESLIDVADSLTEETTTVRALIEMIGEQGMLLVCIILTLPFMTPIAIPGVSTVFGLIIMLIGVGVVANRIPWLPRFVLDRPIPSKPLAAVLRRGAGLVSRIERLLRPRLLPLTDKGTVNRINGAMLFFAGFVLIVPLPIIPFSNFLPALAILLLVAGMLTRDGVFVLLGFITAIGSALYLLIVVGVAVVGGASLASLLADPTAIPPTPMP